MSKIRCILKGHKSAISRLLTKFEKLNEAERIDHDELRTIEASLRQKEKTICELHAQLVDSILEEEEDLIETEILDHDEYLFRLQTKIQK